MLNVQKEFHQLLDKTKTLFSHELGLVKAPKKMDNINDLSFEDLVKLSKSKLDINKKSNLLDLYNSSTPRLKELRQKIDILNSEIDDMVEANLACWHLRIQCSRAYMRQSFLL